ncbi:MAG: MBOAT family O-acyltransferase [Candidatus Omnitrophota bacterium]
MIFNTMTFGVFLVSVFIFYWIVPKDWRKIFLIFASLVFYLYNQPKFFLLIVFLSLLTYLIAKIIFIIRQNNNKFIFSQKIWWLLGIIILVFSLCYFKYARFFIGILNDILKLFHQTKQLPLPMLLAPLGISFFVFEFVHYLTDLYHDKIKKHGLVDFSLFAVFFPTLVSGPIKRFQPLLEQEKEINNFDFIYLNEGLRRIIIGFAKKIIIADTMTPFANLLLSPDGVSRGGFWIATYAYAIKIYFDFAGYSDIAIGVARLFGYRVPENFNWPYLRSNISDFWKNWHMSLSSWIKDYLFIPLGGSRRPMPQVVFNLTLVMALCGLWHGPNYTFVVWGLWHGLGLGVYHFYKSKRKEVNYVSWPKRIVATVFTFHFVLIGWVFFASNTLSDAFFILSKMFFLR